MAKSSIKSKAGKTLSNPKASTRSKSQAAKTLSQAAKSAARRASSKTPLSKRKGK